MRFQINGVEVYASTGGREHKADQPWLIFLHGAGSSHLVWSQQSRAFAYAGYNVLALDFPGHNLSGGEAIGDIDGLADWLLAVMDTLSIKSAILTGHSQGGLVALMTASKAPARVEKMVFIATAAAIPVNQRLIDTVHKHEDLAKSSMTAWGLGDNAHMFDNTVPGFSHAGVGLRVMDLNKPGVLETDLRACNGFDAGIKAAISVKCPTMCVLAGQDRMTPLKSGLRLADALAHNTLKIVEKSGHTLPLEAPRELNAFMREFLKP